MNKIFLTIMLLMAANTMHASVTVKNMSDQVINVDVSYYGSHDGIANSNTRNWTLAIPQNTTIEARTLNLKFGSSETNYFYLKTTDNKYVKKTGGNNSQFGFTTTSNNTIPDDATRFYVTASRDTTGTKNLNDNLNFQNFTHIKSGYKQGSGFMKTGGSWHTDFSRDDPKDSWGYQWQIKGTNNNTGPIIAMLKDDKSNQTRAIYETEPINIGTKQNTDTNLYLQNVDNKLNHGSPATQFIIVLEINNPKLTLTPTIVNIPWYGDVITQTLRRLRPGTTNQYITWDVRVGCEITGITIRPASGWPRHNLSEISNNQTYEVYKTAQGAISWRRIN